MCGDPAVHPQTGGYWGNVNPIGLRSFYDEGKHCAETLFFDYHRQIRVNIRVVRIFNTYGPRSKIIFQPLPQDDPLQRKPDISLATENLGWTPAVDLEERLNRTISYFEMIVRS